MKIHLRLVSEDNHNKDYIMKSNKEIISSSVSFTVRWGRYGYEKMQEQTYPISMWDSKLKEKLRKGYKDITKLVISKSVNKAIFKPVDNASIDNFFNRLLKISTLQIESNYESEVTDITQLQISQAQEIVDRLSGAGIMGVNTFNNHLIDLFHIIPRKMKIVKSNLWDGNKPVSGIIQREQDLLDNLSSQVNITQDQSNKFNTNQNTILDAIGISVCPCKPHETEYVLKLMGRNRNIVNIFRIEDKTRIPVYEGHKTHTGARKTLTLWHGSRSQNWISIMKDGLKIRPSNAVTTGSMFGTGIYFSNVFMKSLGYTSIHGSHWADGRDETGYLGIFEVNVGTSLVTDRHESWMYHANFNKITSMGYDSIYAKSGADLRNPEIIIYHPNQCIIQFIVEVK